jgi:hypothetical protein
MTQVKVGLTEAMETSLITLYGKAVDARTNRPVLGDTMAAQAVDKIDYDFARLRRRGERPVRPQLARVGAQHADLRQADPAHPRTEGPQPVRALRVGRSGSGLTPSAGVTRHRRDLPRGVRTVCNELLITVRPSQIA